MNMQVLDIPFVFALAARLRNRNLGKHHWVTPSTDIVIEGYPRSANTFLYRAIRAVTDDSLRIGHHVHRKQQVTMALRYNIPCFVLFRHPLDAVASYLVREPGATARSCLERYVFFAENALARTDHHKLFILIFEDVIADPVGTVEAILAQVGQPREVAEALIAIATRDERVDRARASLPTPEKEALKLKHLSDIQALSNYETALKLFETAMACKWLR
jgi:hypothetical protein